MKKTQKEPRIRFRYLGKGGRLDIQLECTCQKWEMLVRPDYSRDDPESVTMRAVVIGMIHFKVAHK